MTFLMGQADVLWSIITEMTAHWTLENKHIIVAFVNRSWKFPAKSRLEMFQSQGLCEYIEKSKTSSKNI